MATARLEEFPLKGFSMDDARLKNPSGTGQTDDFDERLAHIRDIRSSERRFCQKMPDTRVCPAVPIRPARQPSGHTPSRHNHLPGAPDICHSSNVFGSTRTVLGSCSKNLERVKSARSHPPMMPPKAAAVAPDGWFLYVIYAKTVRAIHFAY
jgi:hypothetical protein